MAGPPGFGPFRGGDFIQPPVIYPEVMGHLVQHYFLNLEFDFAVGTGYGFDGILVYGDFVRGDHVIPGPTAYSGHALVKPQEQTIT